MSWLDDLRHTRVYENALHTRNTIGIYFPRMRKSIWDSDSVRRQKINRFENERIIYAGWRLDHLIRNACNPNYHREFPNINVLSAIKLYLELLDKKKQSGIMTDDTYKFMKPRIDFCNELIKKTNQVLHEHGYSPVSSDAFHQMATVVGHTDEDIVFGHPFCALGPVNTGGGGDRVVFASTIIGQYWE